MDALVTSTGRSPSWARANAVTVPMALAVAVVALMQTISIPLLTTLPEVFDTNLAAVSWVATITLIVGAAVNPIIGRMGDVYGKRPLLLGCLAAAVVGSVVGALADTLLVVIAAGRSRDSARASSRWPMGSFATRCQGATCPRAVAVITAAGAGIGAGLGPS